jgi:predicted helicase
MSKAKIFYFTLRDEQRKEEKLEWFKNTRFQDIPFERITPDENGNWINLADTDFKTLLPLANKQTKLAKTKAQENAVFKLFSNGVVTARDEWVYDFSEKDLEKKVKFLIDYFNQNLKQSELDLTIKWSEALRNNKVKSDPVTIHKKNFKSVLFRPFHKRSFYAEKIFSDRLTENHYEIFGKNLERENKVITFLCISSSNPLSVLASSLLFDLCLLKSGNGGTQGLPLYRYTESGERVENITDWGLKQFRARYEPSPLSSGSMPSPQPSPDGRGSVGSESPLPVGEDLGEGKESEREEKMRVKVRLKANKEKGIIEIDEQTTLSGVPKEAWEYKLGNRSALEWILDQYKETKPKDKTIAERFDTYRFADYKERVIDLLQRVCTVSVETVKIMREMESES